MRRFPTARPNTKEIKPMKSITRFPSAPVDESSDDSSVEEFYDEDEQIPESSGTSSKAPVLSPTIELTAPSSAGDPMKKPLTQSSAEKLKPSTQSPDTSRTEHGKRSSTPPSPQAIAPTTGESSKKATGGGSSTSPTIHAKPVTGSLSIEPSKKTPEAIEHKGQSSGVTVPKPAALSGESSKNPVISKSLLPPIVETASIAPPSSDNGSQRKTSPAQSVTETGKV